MQETIARSRVLRCRVIPTQWSQSVASCGSRSMPERRRACLTVAALCLLLSSCTPAAGGASHSATPHGGTLRVVEPNTLPYGPEPSAITLDPVLTMTFGDTYEF